MNKEQKIINSLLRLDANFIFSKDFSYADGYPEYIARIEEYSSDSYICKAKGKTQKKAVNKLYKKWRKCIKKANKAL